MKNKKEIEQLLCNFRITQGTNYRNIKRIQHKQKNFFKDLKVLFVFFGFTFTLALLCIFTMDILAKNISGYATFFMIIPIMYTIITILYRMK